MKGDRKENVRENMGKGRFGTYGRKESTVDRDDVWPTLTGEEREGQGNEEKEGQSRKEGDGKENEHENTAEEQLVTCGKKERKKGKKCIT